MVLEDCCSSQTDEIQQANIDDMRRMGAIIMDSEKFRDYDSDTVPALSRMIYQEMLESSYVPEHFVKDEENVGWFNRW